jgi:hypothetical protein
VNAKVWKPGRDIAVNKAMIDLKGKAKEVTTIPK